MAYYRFPVPDRGFLKKKLNEIRRMMKTWPRFYAVFHDEAEDIVPLNKKVKTRYWIEISDEPITNYKRDWAGELKLKEVERRNAYLKRFREGEES